MSFSCYNTRVYNLKSGRHGFRKSDLDPVKKAFYERWVSMTSRCVNPNVCNYKYYGERGIKCLWNTFEKFYNELRKH